MEFTDHEIRSLERELGNVSFQLSLFLDAGLVVSAAFEELINANQNNPHCMYTLLAAFQREAQTKNLSLFQQFFLFSQSVRSKDLMRFASLLLDNRNKGNALADKLDKERSMMQNARLNQAKARAKEAETKLCFPLMLCLVSLIVICSAPALMQM